MIGAIWPSFLDIRNALPESEGITTQGIIGFFIFRLFLDPISTSLSKQAMLTISREGYHHAGCIDRYARLGFGQYVKFRQSLFTKESID
jgi:Cytosine/uracil/thiamine/allantoin permeases